MTAAPASPRVQTHTVRVFYGDTDQMGVAYYANYLRWFEMARNEYLRGTGYPYKDVERDGMQLPVVEAGCRYASPARYDDLLLLDAWIAELGRVRVRFEYRVRRSGEPEALATGFTIHASIDAAGRPQRVAAPLRDALVRFDPSLG